MSEPSTSTYTAQATGPATGRRTRIPTQLRGAAHGTRRHPSPSMSAGPGDRMTTTIQRIENAAIAAAIVLVTIADGQPWWLLLTAFLLFDLSAVGYLRSSRAGAVTYNVVHNYTGPALVTWLYLALLLGERHVTWLALLAGCWAFHVAVDRALGYGLKLESFAHTHLGRIGRGSRTTADRGSSRSRV